jgi:hypothetical protein
LLLLLFTVAPIFCCGAAAAAAATVASVLSFGLHWFVAEGLLRHGVVGIVNAAAFH